MLLSRSAAQPVEDRVPARYRSAALSELSLDIASDRGAVITGPVGCGKTHAMAAIANVHGGVGFVAFTELLETIRAWWRLKGDDAHRFDPTRWAERVPWLFIDDVGTESSRTSVEMGVETLPQIINARYKAARPTCLTTNLSPDELSARYGARMVSRLTETCAWYEMAGDDRRLR